MKNKKFFSALLFSIYIIVSAHHSWATFNVTPTHPRILITQNDIATLQNKSKNLSPYKEVYAALKNRVDGWATPTTNRYLIGYQIQCVVFAALIEKYNPVYLNKVDQWVTDAFLNQNLVNLAFSGDGGAVWGSSDIILGVAMAYDWLYPVLTASKKNQYGTWLRDFQQAVITEQGGFTRDASRSDYSNQFYFFDGMFAISGVALFQEQIDDAAAVEYLHLFDDYVHNHMIPTVNQVGGQNGGWHEGLGYFSRAMESFGLSLEAWRVGANENLFPLVSGLIGMGKWVLYSTQPDGIVPNIGDVSGWPTGWGMGLGRLSNLLATRYQDQYSKHISDRIDPMGSENWPLSVFYILWNDPSVPSVDLGKIETSSFFDGIGWVSMRNGWTANDVFALFYSGNYYFGHQHFDQNSFLIYFKSPLAIDNGKYNVGLPGYKMATRFHNTILLGSPGAETANDDGSAGQGGSSPLNYLANPESSTSNKGDIVLYENRPNYTYVVGDASKAYVSTRLSTYVRKFLYLKPNIFVVFDRVVKPTYSYTTRWLLQSDTLPAITGKEIRITNGGGRLFAKTLIPDNVTITYSTVFSGMAEYGGGNYRTEIVPSATNLNEYFLHVLYASDKSVDSMPSAEQVYSISGNMLGVQFSDITVLFSKNGEPATYESYSITSITAITHNIMDLSPNMTYNIYKNGNLLQTKKASQKGSLEFASSTGGNFHIIISGDGQGPIVPVSPTNFRIFLP